MMRRLWLLIVLATSPALAEPEGSYVRFSPEGGCTAAVVAELAQARQTVLASAYVLTSEPIAQALVAAHRRGVDVQVIVDSRQATDPRSQVGTLHAAGVLVLIDARHAIHHNKVMLIDEATVITGSFNWSAAAEDRNAENLLVLRSRAMAAAYAADWRRHAEHSPRYAPPGPATAPDRRRKSLRPILSLSL
jgi:phosphatidylserine/phosphatidylglycerophosphate/cardiolipin synthase-like enzyme